MIIKAIIFDCDGVLLESADIKTQAFRALFLGDYPDKIDEIVAYHLRQAGISRHVKFRHICSHIVRERYSIARQKQLASDFSRLVYDRVLGCPMVRGARQFLRAQAGLRALYVASGTPQAELKDILRRRRLLDFFTHVWGAPVKKPDAIRRVLRQGHFRSHELAFIGDAESDWRAARECGVAFVRRVQPGTPWSLAPCRWEIKYLDELPAVLKAIERVRKPQWG